MKKVIHIQLLMLLYIILIVIVPASAHRGRIDANGGHYDNETGEYHYHHGYPAHEHINGICPYNHDDQTNHNSSTSYSKATPKPELHLETPDPHPAVIVTTVPSLLPEEKKMSENLLPILLLSSITIIIVVSIVSYAISNLISKKKGYEKLSKNLKKEYSDLEQKLQKEYSDLELELQHKYESLKQTYMKQQEKKVAQDRKLLENVLQDKKISCPTMAKVFADYELYIANKTAYSLRHKSHPAKRAAEQVKLFGERNKELQQKLKEAEYLISYYKSMCPQIKENPQISMDDINK